MSSQFIEGQMMMYERGGNGITKDIEILDSEFVQEESRQIEAYYMSINKEVGMGGGIANASSSSHNARPSGGSMHVPRKSSALKSPKKGKKQRVVSPPAKGYSKMGGNQHPHANSRTSLSEKKLISGVRVGVSRLDQGAPGNSLNNGQQNSREDPDLNRSQVSKSS